MQEQSKLCFHKPKIFIYSNADEYKVDIVISSVLTIEGLQQAEYGRGA